MAERKQRQRHQPPEERLRRATEECRQATREAHEAIQGLKELAAEAKAALTEAQTFARTYVEGTIKTEVNQQLLALVPEVKAALDRAVDHTVGKFDQFAAILLGTERDGEPSIEELLRDRAERAQATEASQWPADTYSAVLPCPHCGEPNNGHTPVEAGTHPTPGAVAVCGHCQQASVFDFDPARVELVLRAPTNAEAAEIRADPTLQQIKADLVHPPRRS